MPPSPSWRCTPNGMKHKQGNNLDGGQFTKEEDDDLALFNHMETKEEDNFLLEPNDDLDESFCNNLLSQLCHLVMFFDSCTFGYASLNV